jgi:hypothetical protein
MSAGSSRYSTKSEQAASTGRARCPSLRTTPLAKCLPTTQAEAAANLPLHGSDLLKRVSCAALFARLWSPVK